jgi:hypothetical protein
MSINQNKGFTLTFENKWTISVQWGTGNYCSVKDLGALPTLEKTKDRWTATSAEICVWDPDGDVVLPNSVMGWVSVDDVAKYIKRVQGYRPGQRAKSVRWRVLK